MSVLLREDYHGVWRCFPLLGNSEYCIVIPLHTTLFNGDIKESVAESKAQRTLGTLGTLRARRRERVKKDERLGALALSLSARWRLPTLPLSQYHRRDKV